MPGNGVHYGLGPTYFSIEKIKSEKETKGKKMPVNGVHYGLRRFSTDSLIGEIKPGTGDSCALCLDSIQEEKAEKVKLLLLKTSKILILFEVCSFLQPIDLKGGNSVEEAEEGSHKIRSWQSIYQKFQSKIYIQKLVEE